MAASKQGYRGVGLGLLLLGVSLIASAAAGRHNVAIPDDVSVRAIPVCYDFGCKRRSIVPLTPGDWQGVAGWFASPADTPAAEREQIRRAIGWMEVVIGRYTPTHKDLAFDLPAANNEHAALFPGQLDCIDEAVNTTVYMRLFESMGLLRHHRVVEQAYRRAVFDQHWAGQIEQMKSGKRYVVDSWFYPNGHLPVVQATEDWADLSLLNLIIEHRAAREQPQPRSFWRRLLGRE